MSEPLTGTATWRPVMVAAGFRCQCTGACGNPHAKGGGRCPREHDHYTSKHHGRRIRLIAAPTDPLATPVAAAALPATDLVAWCPKCHAAAARAARKQAAPAVEASGLFEL
ncbi:hypothetical protein [Streptomyces formicae]|uniref:Uncharacterized protein n=1 Tax=Streptomyces formicae TaxID=1616117 RepID=A0A291Q7W6_9ACTN|nr:hypothetical protein [Streptomyces formicae]ATL27587.1 hypothetical protein KY5_2569 [Streptomyces formicae]